MKVMRGTPERKHLDSGSSVARFSAFSRFFASASGLYGISLPATTPRPSKGEGIE
jgi:hypothetical protein